MGNIIVGGVVLIIGIVAVLSSVKHFKGEGGCCGGGGDIKETKKLNEPKLGEIVIYIEGMHCDNCKNRIEHAVNRIEGAVCKVKLRKNLAVVSYSKKPEDELLKDTIENLGFQVIKIEHEQNG